jgi:16S rRNA (guanine527-N7)-methyltransferase
VFAEILRAKLAGVAEVSDEQVGLLHSHYELMIKWNKALSLTTVTELEEAIERHYCESIFLASRLAPEVLQIADLGSGPGFPGIPVAVCRPDCSVTLIESHQRKGVFLREASRNLKNVRVLAVRAEAVNQSFDRVVSRAVSFKDLAGPLKKLGRSADLLSGGEAPPEAWGWVWERFKLPWGNERYLYKGHAAT